MKLLNCKKSILVLAIFFLVIYPVYAANKIILVAPAYGIDQMIKKFNQKTVSLEREQEYEKIRSHFIDMKDRGEISIPASLIKPSGHYASLDTETLARECFSGSYFANIMGVYATHEDVAFIRLRVFHDGFAELFSRSDMWKGILSVYKMLVKNLDPKMAKIDIINTTTTLDSLTHLYFFPPFKEQLYGREEIFLEANLEALKRFKSFIENYHPTGSMMKIPFYREPFSVARVALMLQQRTNPQNYYAIIPDLAGVRFSSEQKTTDIKKYLDLVIPALEK